MKNSICHRLNILLLIIVLAACGNQNKKENQETVATAETGRAVEHEVVFENQYAKVVKVSLASGEVLSAHKGEKRVIYSLSDYSIEWEEAGKDEGVKTWKKGDVHFHDAGSHAAKNNGDSSADWLAFIKKNVALPECGENQIEDDVTSVSSEFTNVLIDNDDFKVTEVTLPVTANRSLHSGINRLIYSLSDYQIVYESDKEGKAEKTFKSGDIHWHEACQHEIENIGENKANYLVVSYKQN